MIENVTEKTEKIATPSRILLIGVGGMGINALGTIHGLPGDHPELVAIDTDGAVLKAASVPRRVQIGATLTNGQSTGGDVDLGRRSANNEFTKLRELFVDVDLVVLITGLGGGVGSGAAPVIAQTARDEGTLVISVAALPFPFEGDERIRLAEKALDLLRRASHAVVTMPNQYLLEDAADEASLKDAFRKADEQLGTGFGVLWKLLAQHNLINLDFISLKHMLETAGGVCTMVYAEGGGKSKARLVLNRIMNHPAIKGDNVLSEANGLLVGVLGSPDMTLMDVQDVMNGIAGAVHSNARRFMGAGIDASMRNRIGVMLLIGGKAEEPKAEPMAEPPRIVPIPVPEDRKPKRAEQREFEMPTTATKGRFKDVEPTIHEGEDLDLPTFIRRGMKLTR